MDDPYSTRISHARPWKSRRRLELRNVSMPLSIRPLLVSLLRQKKVTDKAFYWDSRQVGVRGDPVFKSGQVFWIKF
jgi:hypothetical protein